MTGASRGAGRGIAAALVADGWRVYLTGRTVSDPGDGGIAVPVDHRDDVAVAALFERVDDEHGGLDLLVNNAAAIHDDLVSPKPFWEKPLELADVLDVGLRSAYVASLLRRAAVGGRRRGLSCSRRHRDRCATCTARPTVHRRRVWTSWPPTWPSTFARPGWPRCRSGWASCSPNASAARSTDIPTALAETAKHAETPEFTGHLINALYRDPRPRQLSGYTVIGAQKWRSATASRTSDGSRHRPSYRHRDMMGGARVGSRGPVRVR